MALQFFNNISRLISPPDFTSTSTWLNVLKRSLAIALQRGNAFIISQGLQFSNARRDWGGSHPGRFFNQRQDSQAARDDDEADGL